MGDVLQEVLLDSKKLSLNRPEDCVDLPHVILGKAPNSDSRKCKNMATLRRPRHQAT
jgi:hypothetical protein